MKWGEDADPDVFTSAMIRRLSEQIVEVETVGELFDVLEAIEDLCEQLREFYEEDDAAPLRRV